MENCKTCHDLSCIKCVRELEKQLAQANAKNAALLKEYSFLKKQIEILTPMGSEFHNDPDRCIEWISDRLANVTEQVNKRKEAEAENETLKAVAKEAQALLESGGTARLKYQKALSAALKAAGLEG